MISLKENRGCQSQFSCFRTICVNDFMKLPGIAESQIQVFLSVIKCMNYTENIMILGNQDRHNP